MAAYLISFRDGGGYGGEQISASTEAEARERWADVHESDVIESCRRVA